LLAAELALGSQRLPCSLSGSTLGQAADRLSAKPGWLPPTRRADQRDPSSGCLPLSAGCSYGEPLELNRALLCAARLALDYPLFRVGCWMTVAGLALQGAVASSWAAHIYSTRGFTQARKAGNLNHALPQCRGDLIAGCSYVPTWLAQKELFCGAGGRRSATRGWARPDPPDYMNAGSGGFETWRLERWLMPA